MLVKVEVNPAGLWALIKGPEVQGDLVDRAYRIAEAAGGAPDYEVETRVGATRARASVRTASYQAMRDEATDRTLLRALDAGR